MVLGDDGLPLEVREFDAAPDTAPPSARLPVRPFACRVASVGEVWRVDDEWWRALITRRYVEVLLEGGKHVMLFEDLASHEWFLQDI